MCRNHKTLHQSAWLADPPERASAERKERFWQQRALAVAFCMICPVQWDCAIFAHETGDLWNVAGAGPEDRKLLRKTVGRRYREAIESMRGLDIPVVDGIRMTVEAKLTTSHVVVRSRDGTHPERNVGAGTPDRALSGLSDCA